MNETLPQENPERIPRPPKPIEGRRWIEIDVLRGVAVIMMIVYHTAYDLSELYGFSIDVLKGGWWFLARSTAVLFLLLVGVSFAIARGTTLHLHPGKNDLLRAVKILSCALLISLATFLWEKETFVRFGILHLIGVSALLLPFFVLLGTWNALLGTIIVAMNLLNMGTQKACLYLPSFLRIPLGYPPDNFTTLDYFPLFPWFGVILLGLTLGTILVRRDFRNKAATRNQKRATLRLCSGQASNVLSWLGRHTLFLYMLHQPLLLLILRILLHDA